MAGCNGGFTEGAYDYLKTAPGLANSSLAEEHSEQSTCFLFGSVWYFRSAFVPGFLYAVGRSEASPGFACLAGFYIPYEQSLTESTETASCPKSKAGVEVILAS